MPKRGTSQCTCNKSVDELSLFLSKNVFSPIGKTNCVIDSVFTLTVDWPRTKTMRKCVKRRFDKLYHLIDKIGTQRRSAYYEKCAKFICIKCNAFHPYTCFRRYKTPSVQIKLLNYYDI